ncbi:MAG: NADH-quinone oxidoreductase subunit M [Candidatus Accumulibacter sp.]|nr:NADH-quinone oxidoreductase subunit M [Accumulibacter sp.]
MNVVFDWPLASCAIWLPVAAGLLVLALSPLGASFARGVALAGAVLGVLVTVPLYAGFDTTTASMQFVESMPWIPLFNCAYALGVDGISLPFVILNSLITLVVVFGSGGRAGARPAQYDAAFLLMSGLMNGIFCALDGMLFYVFFEASLIPLYLIIGVWGGPNRVRAAYRFILFTLAGSLLLLVAFIALFLIAGGSFSIADWHRVSIDEATQTWIFLAFLAAFGVKLPMWPLHTWLPEAHVEAPTGGSIVLAAIALKLGAYGFLRFSLPIVPDAARALSWLVVALSLVAVVYIGLVALAQTDMKKLVAYSSIAHMGFVTLGAFAALDAGVSFDRSLGVIGALIQMVSHGIVAAAMFYCIGALYERTHSRQIADYGGVVRVMPKFSAFFLLFSMANIGMPGTSSFIGEVLVIFAALEYNFWAALAAALTLVIGAAYTLRMYQRVIFGEVTNPALSESRDVDRREFAVLSLLALGTLAIGLYPQPLIEVLRVSVDELLRHAAVAKFF